MYVLKVALDRSDQHLQLFHNKCATFKQRAANSAVSTLFAEFAKKCAKKTCYLTEMISF